MTLGVNCNLARHQSGYLSYLSFAHLLTGRPSKCSLLRYTSSSIRVAVLELQPTQQDKHHLLDASLLAFNLAQISLH